MSLTSFLISSTVLLTKKWRWDYHIETARQDMGYPLGTELHTLNMRITPASSSFQPVMRSLSVFACNTIELRFRLWHWRTAWCISSTTLRGNTHEDGLKCQRSLGTAYRVR